MRLIDLTESPRWSGPAEARTLYHGTTVENARSALEHGLWPSVGGFVKWAYSEYEELGEELPSLVFAADKPGLSKAFNAAVHHVQLKLTGNPFGTVKATDVLRHGALLVLREGALFMDRADDTYYDDHPPQVEPDDYYTDNSITPDYMITGKKLRSFLRRHYLWPSYHAGIDWSGHEDHKPQRQGSWE